MTNRRSAPSDNKLDLVITLLQQLVAIELAREGVTQEQIGKHLHVAKSTVVAMLKGIKPERANG